MLPAVSQTLNNDIEFTEQTSNTFNLDINNDVVFGFIDGKEAVKQAIYLMLETERYRWTILSWDYGAEFDDLFGMPVSWVIPEAERRIKEALLQDERITAVDSFEFEVNKGKLLVTFTARTIYGDIPTEKEVNI